MNALDKAIQVLDNRMKAMDIDIIGDEVIYFEKACKRIVKMKNKEDAIDELRRKYNEYSVILKDFLNIEGKTKENIDRYNKAFKDLENIRNKYSRMLG